MLRLSLLGRLAPRIPLIHKGHFDGIARHLSSRDPDKALPRRLTLCTNPKNPRHSGKLSYKMLQCGRSHDLSRDQKPSIVLTCTS
jgi:hypothetical protein